MLNVRTQIKEVLNKTLDFNSSDEFVRVNLTHDLVGSKSDSCYKDLNALFNQLAALATSQAHQQQQTGDDNLEQQTRKEAIQELVYQLFRQQHPKKQLVLLRVIAKLVNSRIIEVRFVCEFMLNNLFYLNQSAIQPQSTSSTGQQQQQQAANPPVKVKLLSETSTFIWCKVLEFIQKLIPSLDYKSCRDIFKMLLEVVKKVPHSNSSVPPPLENESNLSGATLVIATGSKHKLLDSDESASQQILSLNSSRLTDDIKLESLFQTVSYLLDQENYFMPRYLAINEIKSVLTFGKESYHPRFHYIFTSFIESFIPSAHLISVSGRDRILPIVGCSNLYSPYSFWRFNPATCKFNTSGPLPYFKHVSKPHHDVFFYLLRQNTPQYLLLGLMSLLRSIKSRFPLFEDEFAHVVFETMKYTEGIPDKIWENLRIWNNLVDQFLNLTQIIHLPALIKTIAIQIKDKVDSFKVSRNWLTWFLLNIITSYMNRNRIPEFSDLYEILYKDDEMLPNPDMASFISVVNLSPLSIWIHLNLRMANQDGTSINPTTAARVSKQLVIPEIIQNHSAILQDSMNTQNFQDFRLAACMNAYSTETTLFSPPFNSLLEKIGKNASQQQQSSNSTSPKNVASSVFTSHQPLSFELIGAFTLHVRIHTANYLTCILIQKQQICKVLTTNIPAAIVETFARLLIFDPDNFIKYLTQNLWKDLILAQPQNLPQISPFQQQQQQQQAQNTNTVQTTFLYQQLNLLIELIAFRLKHLSFTHRTTFLVFLNSLFIPPQLQQQQYHMNYIKHPQIYFNAHIAMLKLLTSFTGSDHYELLNSILTATKHGPKYFINPDSEEINKAIILIIARAIVLTSTDLHPLENKDKDDALKTLLNEIMKNTPLFFPDHVLERFPKVLSDFFLKDQIAMKTERFYLDSSNIQYKQMLKSRVEDDYLRLLETRGDTQSQLNFQSLPGQIPANTVMCMLFKLLQDESVQQNFNSYLGFLYLNLNGLENKKFAQAMRTFCDYLVIEAANKSKQAVDCFAAVIVQMINNLNAFTYDRLLFTMTFRNFDVIDFQLVLDILNALFVTNHDFQTRYNDFASLWNSICGENGDWNPTFYSQYMSMHPEGFFFEGIKERINVMSNEPTINTYYGCMPLRCVPIIDFLNHRFIEHTNQSIDTENLMGTLNNLYKFHGNRISYVYNSLMYYNECYAANKAKKKRLLFILASNKNIVEPYFTDIFRNCVLSNQPMTSHINSDYYYLLIQKLVKRMMDREQAEEFKEYSNEFQNPSCQMLYTILTELICLDLVTASSDATLSHSSSIFELFFASRFTAPQMYPIESKELVYWINAAGLIISNLPESSWYSIYERLASIMKTHGLLNATNPSGHQTSSKLFDHFDLYLAEEKDCFDEVTLIIALFHSIWCHSSTNHFQYFVKFLKERRAELVKTEAHFLFICKLIGPFLSKIHQENSYLLINLVEELYDMINVVDSSNTNLYHMDTMCNFFYHLKYRHIGESIKEKIHSLMPNFRPELKKLFKYITSELNQQQVKITTSPLVIQSQVKSALGSASMVPKNIMNLS